MSEAELEEHIRKLCTDLGTVRFHVRDSRGMTPGFPDDLLVGSRGLLWRECKTQKGKLTAAQAEVGQALTGLGYDWAVWRPSDLLSGQVARELTAISGWTGGRGAA
jgi:hypothetical protein